ncbi:MAG: carboxymuconolactone decarboxylase family protein [Chloroflexi bacterium]|nr:carboxymuconolactone decarboxylase family protein [Chloroflexota bacterium]MBI4503891.1 carboxymuconolactone decarboxylase family protein [Chloroflexota bacterium]
MAADRRAEGERVTQRLWGRARAAKAQAWLESTSPRLAEFANHVFSLYARPELDPKTRSLCTIAALTVLGYSNELKLHLYGALNNGATRAEIEEVLLQMAGYGGFPCVAEAFRVSEEVFAKHQRPDDLP